MNVFVDSDVIISSLISQKGAAYLLLHTDTLTMYISSLSQKEIEIVLDRLNIAKNDFKNLIEKRLQVVSLMKSVSAIKKDFQRYVGDIHDAHIVAGAKEANVQFLLTYNMKDFKIEEIKEDFTIMVMSPGQFLQYLRSLK